MQREWLKQWNTLYNHLPCRPWEPLYKGPNLWNGINNILSFGSTLLILGVSKYEQSLFHISCSSNHCTCKECKGREKKVFWWWDWWTQNQKSAKETILIMRCCTQKKSHLSSLSRYAERRRSKGWRTIMKEAGLKRDNYFQAVEKTPIFMQVWFDFVGKETAEWEIRGMPVRL